MFHFRLFVFGFTFPLFGSALRTDVNAQPQVVGSDRPIIATLGDDVILPCHLEPILDVRGLTVEWSRPDLKPDPSDRLSGVEYVHLYRGWREVPDMKIQSYVERTELFTDRLKDGNISLKILNVTLEDGGRYRCFIPKLKSHVKDSIIYLVVEPEPVQTTEPPLDPRNLPTPDPNDSKGGWSSRSFWIPVLIGCLLLVVVGAGVGGGVYLLKQKPQKGNHPIYEAAPTEPLPV